MATRRAAMRPAATRAALLGGVWLGALAMLAPQAVLAQQGPFLYNSNQGDNNVALIDTPSNSIVSPSFQAGDVTKASSVAVRGDESMIYVTNFASNSVSVINTAGNTLVASIPVGINPFGAVVSPDGTRVYVNNVVGNTVSVISTATNSVIATIPVGTNPLGIAVSPDGTRAYVTNEGGHTVSVINTATNTVVGAPIVIGAAAEPSGIAFTPDGTRVYVVNRQLNGNVAVIDTATNAVVATINTGTRQAVGIAVSPDGTRAYVVDPDTLGRGVTIIDIATNTVVKTIAVTGGSSGIAFSPDGTHAYVTNASQSTVFVIDTASGTVVSAIRTGTGGGGSFDFPGICSNGNALLASGLTFVARTSGALACTLASGPTGSPGPVFTGGTMQFAGANIASNLPIILQAAGGIFDTNGNTATLSGQISGPGGLTKIGLGVLVLNGINTYSGPTTVNAGTLTVNGSIANSAVTVNAGGTLAGTGTVGATTIMSGGTFAPGNSPGTMTVQGNLAFQSGALYLIQVNPSTASSTNVTGTASLAGTVTAQFASGSYITRSYTILSAAGGRSGTFSNLSTVNLPAGFTAGLSYTATDVALILNAGLGQGAGLSQNQQNVAGAINNFFNAGGTLPPSFLPIFNLTGANLANALTLLSGEAASEAQQPAFQLTNQFLNITLDPFVDGRGRTLGGTAIGFAPQREELPDDVVLAYAKILKEKPAPASGGGLGWEQRWSVWGAGYGGSNRTTGDLAVVGSHDLAASTAGGAAGLDYRLAPGTVVGFALAGGGTNWSLAQGIGGGKSDAFQAGLYGTTRWGSAYVAAALAFTNHWMSTDRFAFAGDHLTASFNAQSFGGRVEGGYRFMTYYGGLTPYAAIQSQTFHTPGYTETDLNGGGFALGFNSRNATDTRSELGMDAEYHLIDLATGLSHGGFQSLEAARQHAREEDLIAWDIFRGNRHVERHDPRADRIS